MRRNPGTPPWPRPARPPAADVRPLVAVARPWLAGAIAVGLGQAVLLVAQAAVLARLLAAAMYGGLTARGQRRGTACGSPCWPSARASLGWAWEACTEAAARRATAADPAAGAGAGHPPGRRPVRGRRVPGHGARLPAPAAWRPSSAPESTSSTRSWPGSCPGSCSPWPCRPCCWPGSLAWTWSRPAWPRWPWCSAPLLAGLVGMDTAAAVRRRLAALERLGDRFAALVDGLPVLRAFGRARDHERAVAASGEDVRAATLATLRIALLAGLVLELLAAVGTALVAVPLGPAPRCGPADPPAGPGGADPFPRGVPAAAPAVGRLPRGRHRQGRAGQAGPPHRRGPLPAARPPTQARQPARPGPGRSGWCSRRVCLAAAGRSRPLLDGIDLRVRARGAGVPGRARAAPANRACSGWSPGLVAPSAGRCRRAWRVRPGRQAPARAGLGAAAPDRAGRDRPGQRRARPARRRRARRLRRPGRGPARAVAGSPAAGAAHPAQRTRAPLSLGERRRLAVARSLAGPGPRLWLLDEPTAGLDPASARRLVAELSRIIDGVTAIIATHDPAAMALGAADGRAGPRPHSPSARQPPGLASRTAPGGRRLGRVSAG